MFCKLVFETKYFLAEWTRMVSRLVVGCGQMLLQAVTMRKYLKNRINVWFMSFGQGVEFRDYLNAQTEIANWNSNLEKTLYYIPFHIRGTWLHPHLWAVAPGPTPCAGLLYEFQDRPYSSIFYHKLGTIALLFLVHGDVFDSDDFSKDSSKKMN